MRFFSVCFFSFWILSVPLHADVNPLLESDARYDAVEVVAVRSTDTIVLKEGTVVGLIGLKGVTARRTDYRETDEHGFIVRPDDPRTPPEEMAVRSVEDLIVGKKVRLEFDAKRRDPDGRLMAYVYLPDGRMVNAEVLRAGHADLSIRPPNVRETEALRQAYREAREEMRGLQGEW